MTNEYYGAHSDLVPGTKARSGDINAMDQAIVEAFDKVPSAKSIKSGALNYATNTSNTPDHYAVAMDPVITSYTAGLEVKLNPVLPNTGPATLNINGIGNIAIKRQDGTNVLAGDILAAPMALTYSPTMNAFVIPPTGNAHVKAAAASADAAGQSATSANTSATTASNAAAAAIAKAGEASASATTASAAATTATTKAGEASGSATAAAGSASAAATSATSAASSVQTLAAAVTSATTSAGTATTKAGEASQSAASAATSATNLSNAVSAAQAAQSLAQQWASGSGIVAGGKYSAEYYATQAASYANAVATGQMNADWNVTDPASKAYILNKPVISVAASFPAGNTHTISSEPNTLRAITNPTTGLGYAGGVRFRYGYLNDADTTAGTADVIDLSTYTDSTGGGVNSLYLLKNTQRIIHKFAGAGATAWSGQYIAYLSDLTAYLPLAGGTITGARPITFSPAAGTMIMQGDAGQWSAGVRFKGSGGTLYGGFWCLGSADTIYSYSIGDAADSGWLAVLRNGRTLMGRTTEDGSNARLQVSGGMSVAGGISSPDGFLGNATTATTAATAVNADKLGGLPLYAGGATPWGYVARVNSDGVMEVGTALDFHSSSGDGVDFDTRLSTGGGSLFVNSDRIFTAGINRTNYKVVTDAFVVGQLMWKNFGNSHTIFDASNSTSPSGTGVNPNNPSVAWALNQQHPTLMGWNGTDTYGVRVDSARVADTIASGATLTNAVLVKPTIKGYIEQLQALNPGAAITLNTDNGTLIELTTTVASTTITLPTAVPGLSYTLAIRWGANGHTATITGGGLRWANGGTVPTATSVANKIDGYFMTCLTGLTIGRDSWRNA